MKTLPELLEQMDQKVSAITDLQNKIMASGRKLEGDEQIKYNDLKAEISFLSDQIGVRRAEAEADKARLIAYGKDNKPQTDNQFNSMGEQAQLIVKAGNNPGLPYDPRLRYDAVAVGTGLNETTPSEGGFLLHPTYANDIITRMFATGSLLSLVQKREIGPRSNKLVLTAIDDDSRANGSRFGGFRGYWLKEGGAKTASQPRFRQLELTLHKLAALVYVTDELADDVIALESLIREEAPKELRWMAEAAIVEGDGVGKPKGYRNSDAYLVVAKESMQTADTVVAANIFKMYASLWGPSKTSSATRWLVTPEAHAQLWSMTIGDTPIYYPAGSVSNRPYPTLMGIPVVESEFASPLGDQSDIDLVDFSQIVMIEKNGIQFEKSIHVRFVYDESVLRFVYRIDAQPIWDTKVTPYKGTFYQSPYVGLGAR